MQSRAHPEPWKDDVDNLGDEESEFVMLGKAPPKFKEGGQATLDKLQEVNLS